MSLAEREDYEIQQAMSQSMTENQTVHQENGVMMANNPYFGPATREHYDTQKWTMTLPRSFAQEIIGNPDPSDRARGPEFPAFLKSSLAEHRLPALIKILHSIPMGREALLNRAHTMPDYGYDEAWWDGVPIDSRKLYSINGIGEDKGTDAEEIIYETQRLIAFLDETDRAYGNVEALAQIPTLKNHRGALVTGGFLDSWSAATKTLNAENPLARVFQIVSITTDIKNRVLDSHLHHSLDLSIPDTDTDSVRNLYDIMDRHFWGDSLKNDSSYHCLKEAGDIICIQISRQREDALGTGIKIPAILYLDRYFASSKAKVRDMLAAKRTVNEEIKILEGVRDRIMKYTRANASETFDAPTLIAKAFQHFDNVAMKRNTSESVGNAQVASELKVLAESVSSKLASRFIANSVVSPSYKYLLALQESRNSALEKLKEMSMWYMTASEAAGEPPDHKYMLRGVSTSNDTLYVLDCHSHETSDPTAWHWLKLTYSKGDEKPVSRTVSYG